MAEAAPEEAAAAEPKPKRSRATRRKPAEAPAMAEPVAVEVISSMPQGESQEPGEPAEEKPKKAGWWQRKGFF